MKKQTSNGYASPITKKVNNQEHADLNKLSESFTYTVDTKVPEVADKFEVSDQLVNELTFDGDATVSGWSKRNRPYCSNQRSNT